MAAGTGFLIHGYPLNRQLQKQIFYELKPIMLNIQKNYANSFFALLSLPATAMGFALSVQIAALSWILSTKYGFDIHEVGIVWAAGPLAGIIAQPIVGALSDKGWFWGGRRRPYIVIGGTLAALMLLALPNIDIIGESMGFGGATIGIAIIIALTLDLSINVSFNPTRSLIADVTPEGDTRTKGYTWMQTVSGFFGMLAYVIGATIDNYVLIYFGAFLVFAFSILPPLFISEPRELESKEAEHEARMASAPDTAESSSMAEVAKATLPLWGYLLYGVYVIVAKLGGIEVGAGVVESACVIITVIATAYVIWDGKKQETDQREFHKILIAHSFTWWGVQTMFVYMFAYAQYEVIGVNATESLTDAQSSSISQIISYSFLLLNLVGFILPALVLQPMTERFGRVKTHTACLFIMTAGYGLIYLFGKEAWSIYVLMAVCGIGWASVISLPFAIMSERVNQTKMGLFMGIFNLSVVLPQLVASFKMGEVIGASDNKSVVFFICFATLAVSSVLWLSVRESNKKQQGETAPQGGHH